MSAIKGTPPMKVAITRDGDTLTLTIEHADHQSFSRAVDPRATRSMKAYMQQTGLRDVTLVRRRYAHEDPAPRRTVSTFTYEVHR